MITTAQQIKKSYKTNLLTMLNVAKAAGTKADVIAYQANNTYPVYTFSDGSMIEFKIWSYNDTTDIISAKVIN